MKKSSFYFKKEIEIEKKKLMRVLRENKKHKKNNAIRNTQYERRTKRPSWDEYFLNISKLVATRSTCLRRQVGAVVVKEKQILATGYNGAPIGLVHCEEIGCLREKLGIPSGQRHELCRALHAEQNAFLQAARHGINTSGATLYITNQPCSICAKMIINAGIIKIVVMGEYPDEFALQFLKDAGIELIVMKI